MDCDDEKLPKYLTQTFTAHCNAMIYQQVTLSGDAEWLKVADSVIEASASSTAPGEGAQAYPGHKLESSSSPVQTLPATDRPRKKCQPGGCRHGPGTQCVYVGDG